MAYLVYNGGLGLILIAVIVVETADYLRRRTGKEFFLIAAPPWVRWAACYALGAAVWILAPFGSHQFIYFQF